MRPDTEPLNPKLMKRSVKTLVLITISLLSLGTAKSQTGLSAAATLATDVRKVVEDYPNSFANLIGDVIISNPQSTDYRCNFKVNGAEESIITRYASGEKPIVSWQALMLTTEDYDAARRTYRNLFDQLNNLQVGSSRLKGKFASPSDGADFTNTILSFSPVEEWQRKIRVEVVMEAEMMDWKVKVIVYDRDRKDDERGPIVE